jgi:glutamine amidotransferase-like uncharacterized protein
MTLLLPYDQGHNPMSSFRRLSILLLVLFLASAAHSVVAEPIRVAIYDDVGGGGVGPANLERCLGDEKQFTTERIEAEDIRAGVLDKFDVVILPGGSGSKQAENLQEDGRNRIRKFVEQGGGYVGICAGAYLATTDYTWSLGILDAKVLDRKHWARGTGNVQLKMSDAGCKFFALPNSNLVTVYYGQGPLLSPGGKDEVPDYETIATYETEIAKKGAPEGVMKGTTAAAMGTFGKGRVFCFSPHPEKTEGLDNFVSTAAKWAYGR